MKCIVAIIAAISCQIGWAQGSSVSDSDSYKRACIGAATNDTLFETFKQNSNYTAILEHVTYEQGLEYLSVACQQTPEFIPLFEECKKNDFLGHPITFPYKNYGEFSPTTLRYIKVASDLKSRFGSLDNMKIVEIGGGYGGQCLILSKLFKIQEYTIIDLPEAIALTKKYLGKHGIDNVQFLTPQQVIGAELSYDLGLSNYAFSECCARWQIKYVKDVLQNTLRGYLTCNSDVFLGAGVLSIEELKRLFLDYKLITQTVSEQPLTAPGNCIFIWDKTVHKMDSI